MRALIGAGHDVNASSGQRRMTPAHLAAAGGHDKALKLLLAAGADANAKDHNGRTPWALADEGEDAGRKAGVLEVLSEDSQHVQGLAQTQTLTPAYTKHSHRHRHRH